VLRTRRFWASACLPECVAGLRVVYRRFLFAKMPLLSEEEAVAAANACQNDCDYQNDNENDANKKTKQVPARSRYASGQQSLSRHYRAKLACSVTALKHACDTA
jgi:hypothetical protein